MHEGALGLQNHHFYLKTRRNIDVVLNSLTVSRSKVTTFSLMIYRSAMT